MAKYDEIRAALNHIGADDRDMWIRMGAAVKDEMGEDGFHLWDEWSQTGGSYNARDAKAAWKSFKPGHISIGTLFHHARQNGWRPENRMFRFPMPKKPSGRLNQKPNGLRRNGCGKRATNV